MFDPDFLALEHRAILERIVRTEFVVDRRGHGSYQIRQPDVAIQPDGKPYIWRWHVIPRNLVGGNVYLHVQVADDPERPLHDHPWDNQSVILAGGYREVYVRQPELLWFEEERQVDAGMVVHRRAEEAHRIFLLPGEPYTISLFTTGPVMRDWGFWFAQRRKNRTLLSRTWISHTKVIEDTADGRSIFKGIDP